MRDDLDPKTARARARARAASKPPVSATPEPLHLPTWPSVTRPRTGRVEYLPTLAALLARVLEMHATTIAPQKRALPLFAPTARYALDTYGSPQRDGAHFIDTRLVWLDFDEAPPGSLDRTREYLGARRAAALLLTGPSHGARDAGAESYRVGLITERPVTADEYRALWRAEAAWWGLRGLTADQGAKDPTRWLYYGRVRGLEALGVAEALDGAYLPAPPQAPPTPQPVVDEAVTRQLEALAARVARSRAGGRNSALNTAAHSAGQLGLDRAASWAALASAARRAGLDDDEIIATFRSGYTAGRACQVGAGGGGAQNVGTAPGARPALGSEAELATLWVGHFTALSGGVRPVYCGGDLWAWRPAAGLWERLSDSECDAPIRALDGARIGGPDSPRRLHVQYHTLTAVAGTVRRELRNDAFFATAPPGVLFADGFVAVDTATGALSGPRDAAPADRQTFRLGYPYAPNAAPARYLSYLRDRLGPGRDTEATIQCLREQAAATLVGLATRYQRGVLLLGEGATGKSSYVEIQRALYPSEAVCAVSPDMFGDPNAVLPLLSRRLNVCAEVPANYVRDPSRLKSIITGDPILTKRLYVDTGYGSPIAGHLFAANKLPPTAEKTEAVVRRFLLIEFRGAPIAKPDPMFAAKLVSAEGGAIASWQLQGLAALVARGSYEVPASMAAQLEQWRSDGDPVGEFLAQYEASPGEWIRLTTPAGGGLYGHYTGWCEEHGITTPGRAQDLAREVRARFAVPGDTSFTVRTMHGYVLAIKRRVGTPAAGGEPPVGYEPDEPAGALSKSSIQK